MSRILNNPLVLPGFLGLILFGSACGEVTTSGNDNPSPTIESVSPDRGGVLGRTTITITGSGFSDNDAGDTYVIANGHVAADVAVADDSTLTFTLPPGEPEQLIDIVLFNGNGFAALANAIQYNPLPTVESVSRTFIKGSGGGTFSVFGAGFESNNANDNQVFIADVEAESVTVVDDNELEVTMPARPDEVPGFEWLDVTIQNDNGSVALSEAIRFTQPGLLSFARDKSISDTDIGWVVTFIDPASDPVRTAEIARTNVRFSSAVLGNDDRIYVIQGRCRIEPLQSFGTYDPLNNVFTEIGPLLDGEDANQRVKGLAFAGDDLVSHAKMLERLVRIDPETGIYAPVGVAVDGTATSTTAGTTRPLATASANSVYRMPSTSGDLLLQSTVDSTVSVAVALDGTPIPSDVHDLVEDGDDLYALTKVDVVSGASGSSLLRVNTISGAETVLTTFKPQHWALTRTPSDY